MAAKKPTVRERAEHFIEKNGIVPADLLYLSRQGGKTVLHLLGGKILRTELSQKSLRDCLCRVAGKDAFLSVTKGVVLSALQIASIRHNEYTMTDGRTFVGRQRNFKEHKRARAQLSRRTKNDLFRSSAEYRILAEKFDCLAKMPMPFCVLELVWNGDEKIEEGALDLVFRYANPAMAALLGTEEDVAGRSYLTAFEEEASDTLCFCTASARGGVPRVFDVTDKNGILYHVRCFSPADGYCACLFLSE